MEEERTNITVSISEKLLKQIEKHFEGDSLDSKFELCILKGYNAFMEREKR